MNRKETIGTTLVGRLLYAAITSLGLSSTYLLFSRWPSRHFTSTTDYLAIALSIVAGSILVATLPLRLGLRIAYTLIYIGVSAAVLFYYSFWFVGVVFDQWL